MTATKFNPSFFNDLQIFLIYLFIYFTENFNQRPGFESFRTEIFLLLCYQGT